MLENGAPYYRYTEKGKPYVWIFWFGELRATERKFNRAFEQLTAAGFVEKQSEIERQTGGFGTPDPYVEIFAEKSTYGHLIKHLARQS